MAAFVTRRGQFIPTVMPFGLTNAPATFQRCTDSILGDTKGVFSWAHIDDILVFSPDEETHLKHLADIFERIDKVGLRLKITKCQFLMSEMAFLGHQISKKGVSCDPDKVRTVVECSQPT
jgi:hypothetical protein